MNKKITTCYDKNETMRMLAKQDFLDFFGNEEIRKQIDDIRAARPYQCTVDAAMDMFVLGTIYGKRMERDRKRTLSITPDTVSSIIPEYQSEVLHLLKRLWKLQDVKVWRNIYSFIKGYAERRGL